MAAKQARPSARLALAIAVGALIIGALAYAALGTAKTITVTSGVTSQVTETSVSTATLTVQTETTPDQARLYEVAFRQMGSCSPTLFAGPWSVTLGNQTLAEPSNASLPAQGTASPQNPNDTITFSVPDGVYPYTVSPGAYFQPSSGAVRVGGSDVLVVLQGPVTSCTLAVTTSTLSSAVGSVSGANGLTLKLTMNLSTSSSGVTVRAVASDYNLHASPANVTAADAWSVPKQVLQSRFCIPADNPVGISITQGHYTASNVSSAEFLTFINPAVTYTCTVRAPSPVAMYTFSPMDDVAMASGSCGSSTCGYNTTVSDQLVASASYVDGALSGFAPGEYTVVAGDEWGNSLLAYFTVP